jgi:prepilin-type N-terminal cleavage/methylation domain-containing protein
VREGNAERGFTVVELLIVVAILGVLAAVVIPQFMKESTRGKAKSEVAPMFAELANREDQYKAENGTYLAALACPATATVDGTDVVTTMCSEWSSLRVEPTATKLSCSYVVRAGLRAEDPRSDGNFPAWLAAAGLVQPATSWYFIVATCPANEYFTASWDAKLRSKDGK